MSTEQQEPFVPRLEDPPLGKKGRPWYDAVLGVVRKAEGKWMLVRVCQNTNVATSASQSFRKKYGDEFEVVTFSMKVYARLRKTDNPPPGGGQS